MSSDHIIRKPLLNEWMIHTEWLTDWGSERQTVDIRNYYDDDNSKVCGNQRG